MSHENEMKKDEGRRRVVVGRRGRRWVVELAPRSRSRTHSIAWRFMIARE